MYKYFIAVFLTHSVFAQTVNENHELLWEISGNGMDSKSYLFGSFHSNDKRLFNWSDSTYYALNNVDGVALETDVFSLFEEYDTRQNSIELEYDNEGLPYSSDNEATITSYGDEDGMPQFLDGYLQQYCFNAGKNFYQLETVQTQVDLFGNITVPNQAEMNFDAMFLSREDLLETYLKGDIYGVDEFLKMNLSLSDGLYQSVIVDRNIGMTARLDSILQADGSIFCAVGAGHLAGTKGMINLLRGKGYKVRKVLATYSDNLSIDELEVKNQRFYTYENDSLGFSAQFPGKPQEIKENYEGNTLKLIYRDLGQGNTYCIDVYELDRDLGMEDFAQIYIASPSDSPPKKVKLSNGGDAFQGISDSYPEGLSWTRVIVGQDYLLVLRAYGGNKFMNSPRAVRFFDNVSFTM